MQYLILFGGVALVLLAVFAWPAMQKLPMNRVRTGIFGERTAQILAITGGSLIAGVGLFLIMAEA